MYEKTNKAIETVIAKGERVERWYAKGKLDVSG